jgi:hypothetical protein
MMVTRKTDRRRANEQDIDALVRGLDNLHSNLQDQLDILKLGERPPRINVVRYTEGRSILW